MLCCGGGGYISLEEDFVRVVYLFSSSDKWRRLLLSPRWCTFGEHTDEEQEPRPLNQRETYLILCKVLLYSTMNGGTETQRRHCMAAEELAEYQTEDRFKWLATETEQRHTHSLHSKCIKWISSSCISNIFRGIKIVCVIVLIYLHLF